MALRKEQVVLIGTVSVLGFLVYRTAGAPGPRTALVKPAKPPELVHHTAPDVASVLPRPRAIEAGTRDLFSEPKDTRPLPPLDLIAPPIVPLAALRPPPVPGPLVPLWGRFLRVRWAPVEVPDLFVDAAAVTESPTETPPPSAATVAKQVPGVTVTPEQVAARIQSFKKLYDWIRIGDYQFGQIRNPDRYGLSKRADEDILFVQFNPDTGQPRFPGQAPIPVPRKTIADFDFAQTVPNLIEIRRAKFSTPLTVAEYDDALAFAEWCLEQRLETPRALQVAEEMYRRAVALMAQDPAPHLGLARVHEAAFDFEKAFQEYRALIDGNLKGNALPLVSLAQLEARFRLVEVAEARLFEAERLGRTLWKVQEALGRFLLERGRATEAVAHLRLANQYEPQGPESKRARARLRSALGSALLAAGELQEGRNWIAQALAADPTEQEAQAALISADVLADKGGTTNGGSAPVEAKNEGETQRFELLLANGLAQLAHRTPESLAKAKASLVAAAAADPMRAYLPWRSLSFLAETTNHPEEAWRFIELALENDPLDPWTLYQRGRLAAARDDLDGARESFQAALDRDISFVDALAALGELSHRRGDQASAERYFERALALDQTLVNVMALRGVNFLEMGAFKDAEETFRKVLSIDQDQPTARNGLAWCFYRRGDPTEARQRFRDVDDNRRSLPEDDPHRVYARGQIDRITDHLEKTAWTDRFERTSLVNNWQAQESNGPTVSVHDGLVTISGAFKTSDALRPAGSRARIWRTLAAADFVSLEARLTIRTGTTARVGLFVSRETTRAGDAIVEAEVTVSRHFDSGKNTIQTRIMKKGEEEKPYVDVTGFEWKLDVPVLVRIERTGNKETPTVRILFDGVPVMDGQPIPNLGRTTNALSLGIFAEGQVGRAVQVDIDDVEIVQRGERGK